MHLHLVLRVLEDDPVSFSSFFQESRVSFFFFEMVQSSETTKGSMVGKFAGNTCTSQICYARGGAQRFLNDQLNKFIRQTPRLHSGY